jgi:hypothetical protein
MDMKPTVANMHFEQLSVLDLDRTMLNTLGFFACFSEVCVAAKLATSAELDEAMQAREARAQAFDPITYLQSKGHDLRTITQAYWHSGAANETYLYPDVQPYLQRSQQLNRGLLILTYGSTSWQELKLRATQLDTMPYLVTPDEAKGREIASWKTDHGYQVVDSMGRLIASRTIELTDDKAKNFSDLPADCTGNWMQRADYSCLPAQRGQVPGNVTIRSSFDELALVA